MIDELRQIAIFAKTIEHGSFRAAAQALRLSPSVVSHHVAQLEERLGTALLYRSTRKLSLTPDGERMLLAARTMIEAAENGLHEISSHTDQPSGILRLTLPAILSESEIIRHLADFSDQYPLVQLSLDFSDDRRDLISDGYDIAIRAGDMKDSSLKAQLLFKFERRLVASQAYLAERASPKAPADLETWDWLELAPVWNKKTEFHNARKRSTVKKLNSRISTNSAQTLSHLACAGAGLAIIPQYLAAPQVAAGKLTFVLPDWSVDPISVFAVWPPNAPKDGLIKQLVNYLKDNLQQMQ
jgi:DNA-binding transcriptional LysR family regulator